MSFDYSTLVRDRTQADVSARNAKGTYNAEDLNRVTAALDDLRQRLLSAGYTLPRYERIKIDHVVPEPPATSRLPEGYTELAWIESTGTQYVDTKFKPNNNTRVVCEVSNYPSTASSMAIFGSRTSGSASDRFLVTAIGSSYRSDFYNNDVNFASTVNYSTKVTIDKNKNITTIGTNSATNTSGSFTGSYNLTLFALNNGGTMAAYTTGVSLYSCQIYDNGTLIRDFVPCKNPSGTYGLYDMVGEKFYGNAGSGSFTGGEAVGEPAVAELTVAVTEEPTEYDPYLWYDIDVPTVGQMTQYIANVDAVRTAFAMLATTPDTPESMELFTFAKANNIEQILLDVEALLTAMARIYIRSGMAWAYSGEANFYFMN